MTDEQFWKLIEHARKRSEGEPERVIALLRTSLEKLTPEDILSFDRILDQYRFSAYRRQLWGAAYLLNGGCSDDGFEYFRCWLISQGRDVYLRALEDPDSLSEFASGRDDLELEEMLYVAREAYEARTGEEMSPNDAPYPELTGPEWTEDVLEELFPRIAARLESA